MRFFQHFRVAVATDVAVFSIRDGELVLLLVERGHAPFKGKWALPGGFVESDEDLLYCAKRELFEETGARDIPLRQIGAWGAPDRDPRGRVVSIAYYALAPSDQLHLKAASDARNVRWFSIDSLPALAFDHEQIAATARQRLKEDVRCSSLVLRLLPLEFTVSEVCRVWEIIQGEPADERSIQRWLLGLGVAEETGRVRSGLNGPSKLYRLKEKLTGNVAPDVKGQRCPNPKASLDDEV